MSDENQATNTEPRAAEQPLVVERLSAMGLLLYIVHGVGLALGLTLLWVLELVRNRYFGLLDRMNVKARNRRASAFPPGRPRKRGLADASR